MLTVALVINADLADGRTDGPDTESFLLQPAQDLPGLSDGKVGYIAPFGKADLKSVQLMLF